MMKGDGTFYYEIMCLRDPQSSVVSAEQTRGTIMFLNIFVAVE